MRARAGQAAFVIKQGMTATGENQKGLVFVEAGVKNTDRQWQAFELPENCKQCLSFL